MKANYNREPGVTMMTNKKGAVYHADPSRTKGQPEKKRTKGAHDKSIKSRSNRQKAKAKR